MLDIKNKGKIESKRILNIAKVLLNSKAEDVVIYNVKNKTPLYNYMIIVSANNERKLNGLLNSTRDALFTYYKDVKNVEGRNNSKWIVVDAYDVVVHLIEENERQRLTIDDLYTSCPHILLTDDVVVPETIIVHDGVPTNSSAPNYFVPYRDYIKNVASSEIYSTWPESTIVANVLAIMSFTLNRVYTEWYRNKGYDFTITSSTAFDHKWIYGRNFFESISVVVDEIFDQYLSRPNVKQPILTQYCDGKRVSCPDWMTQWGSMSLGEQGYSPIEILRYFYGNDIYINSAEQISGIPASWPGYDLTIGSSGNKVRQMQEQLLTISNIYTAIPTITPSGYFGEDTAEAVREFQSIFGLGETGIVDFPTWYKISQIYVGVTRIGELNP